ncbi:MAG: hypothetical protein R3F43_15870 [bacterium]
MAVAVRITLRWFGKGGGGLAGCRRRCRPPGPVAGLGIQAMASADAVPFIYFQF